MTTEQIRKHCDMLDAKFGKDVNHLCILISNKDVVEAIASENKLAVNNSDIEHDVIARMETIDLLYQNRDEIQDVIYNYMEEEE